AVHDRDPDRDRRDPARAARGSARDPRARRAFRARPGGDRPELPRQAGDADGGRAGAVARRAALDVCGRAARARPALEHPGAAELDRWVDAAVAPHVLALADGEGLAREDEWAAGAPDQPLSRAAASFKGAPGLLPAASLQGKDAQVGNGSVPEVSRPKAVSQR